MQNQPRLFMAIPLTAKLPLVQIISYYTLCKAGLDDFLPLAFIAEFFLFKYSCSFLYANKYILFFVIVFPAEVHLLQLELFCIVEKTGVLYFMTFKVSVKLLRVDCLVSLSTQKQY